MASALDAAGVPMAVRMVGAAKKPTTARVAARETKKVTADPITFLTVAMSRAPTDWAIRMLAAMATPKIDPSSIIMMMLALPMAVIAVTPRVWLTQNWFTLPF